MKINFGGDESQRNLIDGMKINIEIIKGLAEMSKQRNLWVVQLITIASAILGGLFLLQTQQPQPIQQGLAIKIGLGLLLVTILIGLIVIYRANNDITDRITFAYIKSIEYYFNASLYFQIGTQDNLSPNDQKTKDKLEEYLGEFFSELGVIDKNGNLGSISEKLLTGNEGINWPNYLLIGAFFIASLILIFPKYMIFWLN